MDMDLDISEDKIESFLLTKLEEIRLKNESLETVLNQHKQALKYAPADINEVSFKVLETDSWKKICNNKYTIGYVIFSPSKKNYKDITVLLTWDSEEIFSYKVETFSVIQASQENCKENTNCNLITDTVRKRCDVFRGKTYIVVTFDVPRYLHKLEYNISGSLVCNMERQVFNIPLPKVTVSAKDSTTNTYWISESSLENIFSIMTCSNQTDLVMILPDEWTASLISTFEIHCAFTHIKVSISCKSYFVANDVSKVFNNSLIVVHSHSDNTNILFLNVYAASSDQIYALCHHIGSCLQNIVFFPHAYYESYLCKNALFSKELLKEFQRNMHQELELIYKFSDSIKDGNQLRLSLSTTETNTDKLFLQIMNMKY